MKTAIAMKKQGLKYFSSLTPSQKDKTIFFIVKAKLGLSELSEGLAKAIISQMNEEFTKTRDFVDQKIKNQKCFNYEGNFYPLNIKEIIQAKI